MNQMSQNNWLIYILECGDGSLYCGITNNIEKRLKQHKGEIKGGAKYTRSHLPCKLVYEEKSASRSEALQREAVIKKMSRDEKQALLIYSVKILVRLCLVACFLEVIKVT